MKINVASVLKNDGASVKFSGDTELGSFDFCGSPIAFDGPVSVNGTVLNIGGTIEITADIKGSFATQCSRCCEDITESLEGQLFESVKNDFSDADEECLVMSGNVLDIDGAVRACVFDNLPLKFLCSEDCKGLCQSCGANLNRIKCDCDTTEYDPRLAIFRNLQQ